MRILYEDNHLLAVDKPAGLPTMGTPAGKPTLLSLAKEYVKQKYRKPGNVYLGVMSRLDAPVTGVVLLARTSKAARRLSEQFRRRTVQKTYWALVEGIPQPAAGMHVDWLAADQRHRRMHVVGPGLPGAREARLAYRRLAVRAAVSLVEVELQTGRKHQIRLQLGRTMGIRSWATASTAAGGRFPRESPCTRGGWWWPTLLAGSRCDWNHRCRRRGPLAASPIPG